MKKYLIILLLFCGACSTSTVYNIDLDLLSFFEESEIRQAVIFPASLNVDIFLFPGIETSLDDSGPGTASQQGIVLSFPPQDADDLGSISVKFEIKAEITNKSSDDNITGDRISLYLATVDTENIYTEGIRFDLFNVEVLLPGESVLFSQEFYLEEENSLLDILQTGTFRIGMGIFLKSSAEFVSADCRLDGINLSSSFTPLELLRRGDSPF